MSDTIPIDSLPIHMYYNTALRNVALMTSVSLALLAGSRFFIGKNNEKRRQLLVYFSIGFLTLTLIMGALFIETLFNFINDHKKRRKPYKEFYKWLVIPVIMIMLNIGMLVTIYFANIKKT